MNVHPITLEVVRNAFVAYSEEMATALCRSAYNMMIYEVRDFCCGLIDTEGRLISQNSGGLPIFLADLGVAVGADRTDLSDLSAIGNGLGLVVKLVHDDIDCSVDAALQLHRVVPGGHQLQAGAEDGLGQQRRCGRSISSDIRSF